MKCFTRQRQRAEIRSNTGRWRHWFLHKDLSLVTLLIAGAVVRQQKISADIVMGGLCVYVLMGVFWTILFVNLEILKPGSFSFGMHGPHPDIVSICSLLSFYSYVTLLTIGYGDVVPMSDLAQTLTILEGLIGQIFNGLTFFCSGRGVS